MKILLEVIMWVVVFWFVTPCFFPEVTTKLSIYPGDKDISLQNVGIHL
jgi:hypothetical protein